MKIIVRGDPVFLLEFTDEHITLLMDGSAAHYDGTCKLAGRATGDYKTEGFIACWDRIRKLVGAAPSVEPPDEPERYRASFRELDICTKILEQPTAWPDTALVKRFALKRHIETALRAVNDLQWHTEIETEQFK